MKHDILVCGTGIVGLAAALALARRGQPVALLGPRPNPPAAEPDRYHPRVYALSPASQRFLEALGAWDALPPARLASVAAMEIAGDAGGSVHLHAWQAAQAELAWIVESSEIERVLAQAARMSGLPWIEDRCTGFERGAVLTEGGRRIETRLAVAADGAGSPLRAAAGLTVRSRPYGQTGLVAHLDAGLAHGGTAFQWFRPDGVLALLPMPDTADGPQVSMVWSLRDDLAAELRALPADEQARALRDRLDVATAGRLGPLRPRGAVHGFPLALDQAPLTAPGLALVGDAAHRVHPLAGQGLNLGLGDARALAEIVGGRETWRSPGDPMVLGRYRRARAEPLLAMRLATDGLHRLFEARSGPLVWLRNRGMQWVERLPAVKRGLIAGASR